MNDFGLQLAKVALSLALVVALMVATVYGLKRFGHWAKRPGGGNTWIEVLAQHPVGLKHYLLLVKVREQIFLLGVSPQGMHFLSPIENAAQPVNASQPTTEDDRS